jgi:hypothetical protein
VWRKRRPNGLWKSGGKLRNSNGQGGIRPPREAPQETLPSSSPGWKSIRFGLGTVWPPGQRSIFGMSWGIGRRIPVDRVVVQHAEHLGHWRHSSH